MSQTSTSTSAEWVRFNVGGTVFCTTLSTIAKDKNSFLFRLVDNKDQRSDFKEDQIVLSLKRMTLTISSDNNLDSARDSSGAFLIDRDPGYFGPVRENSKECYRAQQKLQTHHPFTVTAEQVFLG